MRTLRTLAATAVLVLAAPLGACSGGSDATADPAALLAGAKATLDAAQSVHFVLSSADLPPGVTALVGGTGDAARPDTFAGDLDVTLGGLSATVPVVSVDGVLYAKLPFSQGFTTTDPATVGISDPGKLLATDGGVTGLLSAATGAKTAGDARIGDTVVTQVTAELPAAAVAAVLALADDAGSFTATFGIDPATDQLLQAEITGPFLAAGTDSTYTVKLSDYGKAVDITAPTTG